MEGGLYMKIMITGIHGYIGSVLSQELLAHGHQVSGIDTGFYNAGQLYEGGNTHIQILKKDIRNVTEKDLTGFDAVVHLADLSNDPLGTLNQESTFDINYKGAVDYAKNAKKAGVGRFVYSSSCSVYGIATEDLVTETSSTNPQTTYALCKVKVEHALQKLASDTFVPVFLRNATVYGLSPRMRFDLVVNNLVGHAIVNKEIRLTSDGSPWRPLVHIKDVCTAFRCALEAPAESVKNQIFNVGHEKGNYTMREVAGIIQDEFPDCRITFGTSSSDTRSYRVSFKKISSSLPGFSCRYDIRDGIKELKKLFEKTGLTREQFEGKDFTRLKMVQFLLEKNQLDSNYFWISKT